MSSRGTGQLAIEESETRRESERRAGFESRVNKLAAAWREISHNRPLVNNLERANVGPHSRGGRRPSAISRGSAWRHESRQRAALIRQSYHRQPISPASARRLAAAADPDGRAMEPPGCARPLSSPPSTPIAFSGPRARPAYQALDHESVCSSLSRSYQRSDE